MTELETLANVFKKKSNFLLVDFALSTPLIRPTLLIPPPSPTNKLILTPLHSVGTCKFSGICVLAYWTLHS